MNSLTDRNFWKEYWNNYVYEKVPQHSEFEAYFPEGMLEGNGRTAIEIGGFPGTMSLYFKRHGYSPTLLDFYIDPSIIEGLEESNGFSKGCVEYIESDFFAFSPAKLYDLVFSIGFIEHFDDTADVIRRHADLVKPGGTLFIALPNFRGLNGLVQRIFDRRNYDAHNINSMIPARLRGMLAAMPLRNVKVAYTRKPMLWLEPRKGAANAVARRAVRLFSYAAKLFPVPSRLMSPYIVISAEKI
jgi:2-polyprenyl-3-methyl-5-hydroxy-6-metoxy-1,4-benzoquinol methylase